jgi:hypothetical protein
MLQQPPNCGSRQRSGLPALHHEGSPVISAMRFRNRRAFVGALAIAALLVGCSAEERLATPTRVGGVISSNARWNAAGNPYVLTDDVTVSEGVTLTLSPGAVVKADSISRELIVLGTLVAEGTSKQPIILTSYKDDTAHGDTNGDGKEADIVDLTTLADYLFNFGSLSDCVDESDVNADGAIADIVDLTHIADYLFASGPPPAPCF